MLIQEYLHELYHHFTFFTAKSRLSMTYYIMDIFLCEVRQMTQVLIIEQPPHCLAESLPFVELLFVTKKHSMYMYYSRIHTAADCGFGIWL